MSYYLGLDLGTSYFKAGIFDEQSNLIGLGRSYVEKRTGIGKICELPIVDFWNTLRESVQQAVEMSKINPNEIVSMSYSSQANSFILLDENDIPLTPLILWPDKRAEEINSPLDSLLKLRNFKKKTGLGILPAIQSMAAKIVWFQQKRPEIWEKVHYIMSISDYLTFSLTGQKVSDYSTASMTGLFDVTKEKWWDKALNSINIDINFLSVPKRTGFFVGNLTKKGANQIGFSSSIKFFLGGLDHHMVAVGSDLQNSKNISESTGTVLACVNYTDGYNPQKGINVAPGLKKDFYFQMAFNENGAAALEWYQKNFAPELSINELLKSAENIAPNSNGLIALPCANKTEGLSGFQNIKKTHSHGHFVRAILESTGRSLRDLTQCLDKNNESKSIVSSGGGAQSHLWTQIKADTLNKAFIVLENSELACQGAARIGMETALNNLNEKGKNIEKSLVIPISKNVEKYNKL